jgi:uncharacterized membrane protein
MPCHIAGQPFALALVLPLSMPHSFISGRSGGAESMWVAPGTRKHIDRWLEKGLIHESQRRAILAELESQSGGFGLGGVLAVLGALLLGAAVITLIAANWDAIPRLGRVGIVIALIWLGYLGGAWRERAGDAIFSQVFYLVAGAAFGGGIALVGQMYHLSGDTSDAALVWALGVIIAAALLRSFSLSALAGGVGLLYLWTAVSEQSWHSTHYIWVAPLMALVLGTISWWNRSNAGLHAALWLLMGTIITWRFMQFGDDPVVIDYLFAFGGAAAFFAIAKAEGQIERLTRFAGPLLHYALLLSFFGFAILQIEQGEAVSLMFGILVIGLSIGALILKGRDHGKVRSLAYTAFAAETLYLAFVTVGSLIGTSAFFLFAGLVVLFIAFVVIRIEKRLKSNPEATG